MKIGTVIFVAILACVVLAQRPTITVEPSFSSTVASELVPVITSVDLLVHEEITSEYETRTAIIRRNNEGTYERVANFPESSQQASTNGRWVGLWGKGMLFFRVDQNNSVSDPYSLEFRGGSFLADDTFVGFTTVDGITTISTLEFNSADDYWQVVPGTELNVTTQIIIDTPFSTIQVTDTHLVVVNLESKSRSNINRVDIYERNADKSWKFIESVPVNSPFGPGNVVFNGVDALVYGSHYEIPEGAVLIYTKIDGEWVEQLFNASAVGYNSSEVFGLTFAFASPNALLLASPLEGVTMPSEETDWKALGGRVLLLTRNDTSSLWEPALDLVSETGALGLGIGINDYDVVISSIESTVPDEYNNINFYTIPVCLFRPIDVTCHDQAVNTCTDFSSIDVSSMEIYTINNECGQVTANVTRVNVVSDKIEAQLSFSRDVGQSASCQVTVTCSDAPTSTPTVQTNTPVAATSTSTLVAQLGVASVFCFIIALL